MLAEEREYVKRTIALMLDHPSVFMGGPSQGNLRRAGAIMDELERQGRLVPTTCTHDEHDPTDHGIACPACGMHVHTGDRTKFLFK